jgi:hypothetical protein
LNPYTGVTLRRRLREVKPARNLMKGLLQEGLEQILGLPGGAPMPLVLGAPILVLASRGSDDTPQGAASEGGERAQALSETARGEGTRLTKGDLAQR